MSEWAPPEEFDEYRLLRPLGRGAMGQVYLAHDSLLDRTVAIKFIGGVNPSLSDRQRFLVEARAIARLAHPNVVAIHRAGEVAGRPYLVSEFIRGQGLERISKPIPWEQALRIAIGLSRGLGAAHRRGVLHRDIKPANVILAEDGEVKLLDFGLAKLLDAQRREPVPSAAGSPAREGRRGRPLELDQTCSFETRDILAPGPSGDQASGAAMDLTGTGASFGTPLYMAPEAWRGEPATSQTDIYSLGTLLYELCAGRVPYDERSPEELGRAICGRDAPLLAALAPQVNPRLCAIVDRCLRRDPEERFASGEELCRALEQLAQRRRRLAVRALIAGFLLLPGLMYGGIRLKDRHDLDRAVDTFVGAARAALTEGRTKSAQAEAAEQQAFALFDSVSVDLVGAADPGATLEAAERGWSGAQDLAQEAEAALIRASQALEAALLRDVHQDRVRELLADVTYERILLAERAHRAGQRDELYQRLANYDGNGTRRRRLDARAALAIETTPAGAQAALQRYEDDAGSGPHARQGPRRLASLIELGATPVAETRLRQGSYLLTLSVPGRPAIRAAILLARGEEQRLTLALPAAVPEGHVYVPPGCFLFGSAEDEDFRRSFLHAPPQHRVCTGAYLIGRHEVTFGEWMEYLRALPAEERARRLPQTPRTEGRETLRLKELGGGAWELTMQPTTRAYAARAGEPIRYEGRGDHAIQDWLRFPVSGISREDALGYLGWLDRSGRLPGARLCDEHEWERAARGADGRIFPHGSWLAPQDANFDETYGRNPLGFGPDEVGSHPASVSPFGVFDMAGNVYEWTRSSRQRDEAVYRGGAWYYGRITSRSSNRETGEPTTRDIAVGLRACATFPSP